MPHPRIVVHHLNDSRSQRVLWLLEELGLPYEIVQHQRDPRTMLAPAELKRIHPLGKSPVVVVNDEVLAESGAIIEELVERFGQGRFMPAAGTPARSRYRYWMHYAEGSAMPQLLLKLVGQRIRAGAGMPFFLKPMARAIGTGLMTRMVDPQLERHLAYLEGELGQSPWFAGDEFTAADVQMSFPLEAAQSRAGLDARHPRLQQWLQRIHARPAYRKALQAGGPYGFAS